MPEIVFKGKEYVYNHHLTVPYRPLVAHAGKGIGPADLGGNLVIHGDNLHALKSLLPRYAGKVDLVFIDPPYNTGNEGWCYSDGVNSPIMKEWLSSNPVDVEDMLRHDKWLCMMWPRLVLLRELLSERGSLWMTLDDNEVHRARMVMDEIFGDTQHLAKVIWEKADSPKMDAETFSTRHDTMLVYGKNCDETILHRLTGDDDEPASHYDKLDEQGRRYYLKPLRAMGGDDTRDARPSLHFQLDAPDGTPVWSSKPDGTPGRWRWGPGRVKAELARIEWRRTDAGWSPYFRIYADTSRGLPPETIFYNADVGSSRSAAAELKSIMGSAFSFATPKPTQLVERALAIGSDPDALVLDSFAGSGTTAHAVLKANARDGGTRRFILVEGEDYADTLTAERVRRAIKGYAWVGTQRETLLEQKITFTQFKKADEWLKKVEAIKAREGFAEGDLADQGKPRQMRFDKISINLDDGMLRVEGEKRIAERVEGLGGDFSYCTLGEAKDRHVWLLYRPELSFLKSPEAALTLSLAKSVHAWGVTRGDGKGHLVFAPAKYLSNRQLLDHGVSYAPLPFALYRES